MADELKSIENILKEKSILTLSILILIIFLVLLLYRNLEVISSLFIILILSLVIIIFSYIYYKIIKKERGIQIEELEKKGELENITKERVEKEILKDSLNKINPDLSRFFQVLDNKGIKLLKEVEEEVEKIKTKVYFIVESAEKTNQTLKNFIGGTTFFTYFIQELSSEYNIFRINIFGTNTFLIISENGLSGEEIIKKYYSSLKNKINQVLNDGRVSQQNKQEVSLWYRELLKNNKPIILITQPYAFSLLTLINMLSDKIPKKDVDRLFSEVNQLIRKEVKIFNIKFSYLLIATEFNEEIIKKFESLEPNLIISLSNKLQLKNLGNNYFSTLLNNKDFKQVFESSLNEINKDFFDLIRKRGNYRRLLSLIDNFQINIFNIS